MTIVEMEQTQLRRRMSTSQEQSEFEDSRYAASYT